MKNTSEIDGSLRSLTLPPEVQANPIIGILQFFNGDSINKIRSDLDNLRDTTITESYGDLDKDDKWLLIVFLGRISNLIEVAHLLVTSDKNTDVAEPSPG